MRIFIPLGMTRKTQHVLVLRGYDDLIDVWKTHVSIREIQGNSFGSFT